MDEDSLNREYVIGDSKEGREKGMEGKDVSVSGIYYLSENLEHWHVLWKEELLCHQLKNTLDHLLWVHYILPALTGLWWPFMSAHCLAVCLKRVWSNHTPSRFQRLQLEAVEPELECVCIQGWDQGEARVRMHAKSSLLFSTVPIKSHSRGKIHVTYFREELQSVVALL